MGTAGDVLAVVQTDSSEKAISIWESENFFFDLEPLPGAVEAVKQMANLENTDVFICTSPIKRYKYCPYEKYAWVEKHLGPDFLEQVVLTRDKTVVSADLLIDDRPDITGKWPGQDTPGGNKSDFLHSVRSLFCFRTMKCTAEKEVHVCQPQDSVLCQYGLLPSPLLALKHLGPHPRWKGWEDPKLQGWKPWKE
ncbi:5',3'-nucleotidase, mitochondrial [Phyllostomus discolor]|uniref:5',3'-nucleotidase, mitochondrial n=1 Tax=Phyllostomus discolor TaxID=89673 RepID=A0A833ZN37_9CHIR|nr:5',3'-nucleotidase, mitochondrial [Phyllostomus discolor]